MLQGLSIRDVVLIDRLDLSFESGLNVLTGETGAGKSILLDSLGLATGQRAEARLVRHGAAQASVTADYILPLDHPVFALLSEHGIACDEGQVLLRRVLSVDGRSRAFVNDQAVSVALLRQLGEALVEVHGQFDNQRLLNPSLHRALLDAHGGLEAEVKSVHKAFHAWRDTVNERKRAEDALESAKRDEEFLRHAVKEMVDLNPQTGEEDELAKNRQGMMHGEKLLDAMKQSTKELGGGRGVERMLRDALRHLEPVADKAGGLLTDVLEALDTAAEGVSEAVSRLARAAESVDVDPSHMEQIEERLFALRALARKHGVTVEGLPAFREELEAQLNALLDGGASLDRLMAAEKAARSAFVAAALDLGGKRKAAAADLDAAVCGELEPLRMGAAAFVTDVAPLDEANWSENGCDRVAFQVSTNPGAPAGPISKIASGGELSRFMLALKVVLAQADPVPTLVFDEVDAGIGGAVAAAVGGRLEVLSEDVQVLVVTHSPQVAARGLAHYKVAKSDNGAGVRTSVSLLSQDQREEEIARMLSGETVTGEALAAARSLMSLDA